MVSADQLAALAAASFVLIVIPGLSVLFAAGRLAYAFATTPAPRRHRMKGCMVGLANPQAVILFAAVLPEFVNRRAGLLRRHPPASLAPQLSFMLGGKS